MKSCSGLWQKQWSFAGTSAWKYPHSPFFNKIFDIYLHLCFHFFKAVLNSPLLIMREGVFRYELSLKVRNTCRNSSFDRLWLVHRFQRSVLYIPSEMAATGSLRFNNIYHKRVSAHNRQLCPWLVVVLAPNSKQVLGKKRAIFLEGKFGELF